MSYKVLLFVLFLTFSHFFTGCWKFLYCCFSLLHSFYSISFGSYFCLFITGLPFRLTLRFHTFRICLFLFFLLLSFLSFTNISVFVALILNVSIYDSQYWSTHMISLKRRYRVRWSVVGISGTVSVRDVFQYHLNWNSPTCTERYAIRLDQNPLLVVISGKHSRT